MYAILVAEQLSEELSLNISREICLSANSLLAANIVC
jgi:hypothetical protein